MILKLSKQEKSLLSKVLNYQLTDVAFLDSIKGSNYKAEKKALIKLMEKLSNGN